MTFAGRPWYLPRLDGLAVRVAAFLTVALLPVGLIALYQTREFQHETQERAGLTLLALTAQGASGVQRSIERTLGAAEALGVVSDLAADPATCGDVWRRYVEGAGFAFAGLLPAEGPVTCSSAPAPFELRDRADMADLMERPRLRVRATERGQVSGQDVIVVVVPLMDLSGFTGYLGLSVPRDRLGPTPPDAGLAAAPAPPPRARPLRLVTFNAEGEVLTADHGGGGESEAGRPLDDLLPAGRALSDETGQGPRVFMGRDAGGDARLYTVTPLIPGVAYAMGIWSPAQGAVAVGPLARAPLLFPLLMWAVSLAVAFWAINRLVIRQVADLGRGMQLFGSDRSLGAPQPRDAAHELREIDAAFRGMADAILHDEALMENAFRERGVLLREVHHRVKNNLQLISSIISMQVRRSDDPALRAVLRRLQERVLTLATIYRSLYTSADMADVNAADVLRAVARQEAGAGVDLQLDLVDIVMVPDQIVPLAFLAAEGLANAVAAARSAGTGAVSMTLASEGEPAEPRARLAITSPAGAAGPAAAGLGAHLIRAFAAQLGGAAETEAAGGAHVLAVAFPLQALTGEP